ncbi:hypothetical protein [Haliangium sp.]|uniref:hypothetical protein n=1 Tax=Haliangium sp. TaxID=2663208 RepID=UPI003D12B441
MPNPLLTHCSTPIAAVLAALAVLLGAAQVQAQAKPSAADQTEARRWFEQAEAHKQRGDELVAAGDQAGASDAYGEAAEAYTRAFELYEHPGFIYNLAQMRRLRGELRKAIRAYETYLVLSPDGAIADQARRFIAQLTIELDARESAAGASTADAADSAGATEPDAGSEVEPARGTEVEPTPGDVDTGPKQGGAAPAPAEPGPADHVVPVSEPPPAGAGRGLRIAGLATAAAGVVALGLGVKFGLDADAAGEDLSTKPPGAPWTEADRTLVSDGEAAERNMFIALGVGGAAVVAGGVMYFLGASAAAESPMITAAPGQGGFQVAILGRF